MKKKEKVLVDRDVVENGHCFVISLGSSERLVSFAVVWGGGGGGEKEGRN